MNFKKKNETTRRLKKLLWYISISRNALVVFVLSFIAYMWIKKSSIEAIPFSLSSKVTSGLPQFKLPPFSFESGNRTYGFFDICSELGSGLIVVPIVAVLANVAIAKAFGKLTGVVCVKFFFLIVNFLSTKFQLRIVNWMLRRKC